MPISATILGGTNISADVNIQSSTPGTGAANLGKSIGATVGPSDTAVGTLVKRVDTLATLPQADGSYVPPQVDSQGRLHTTAGTPGVPLLFNVDNADGGTTGTKLSYTVPANRSAVVLSATYLVANGVPTMRYQITSGGVSSILSSITTTQHIDTPLSLEAGDLIEWNVSAAAAGSIFDLTISVVEFS